MFSLYEDYLDNEGNVNEDTFFTSAERSNIVEHILRRIRCKVGEKEKVGIRHILAVGSYWPISHWRSKTAFDAAFPLHDSLIDDDSGADEDTTKNIRGLLYNAWAKFAPCTSKPDDKVHEYLGEKDALYFEWLDFYSIFLTQDCAKISTGMFH